MIVENHMAISLLTQGTIVFNAKYEDGHNL